MEIATLIGVTGEVVHEDLHLAKRCSRQDAAAMQLVYESYGPQVLSLCRRYAANNEEALDCLHDGFVKVFEKIGTYKGNSPLYSWVKAVIVNNTINQMKKKTRMEMNRIYGELEAIDDDEEDINEEINPDELFEAIQELPLGYRMVLNMYVFEKMSHEEIGNKLNITPSTSRTQLMKARRSLKKMLNGRKGDKNEQNRSNSAR